MTTHIHLADFLAEIDVESPIAPIVADRERRMRRREGR